MAFFDLVRDTLVWQVIRLVTGGKVPQFQYYDERRPIVRQKYATGEDVRVSQQYRPSTETQHFHVSRSPPLRRNASDARFKKAARDPYSRGYPFDIANPHNSHWSSDSVDTANSAQLEKTSSQSLQSSQGLHLVEFLADDPENPRNWPLLKKVVASLQICLLIATTYAGASIYTVGSTGIKLQFHVSETVALLGLTTYVVGYGVGPLVWSPLFEIPQIGRNAIYIAALIVFILVQVPIALATNIEMLLAFRFVAGFFGSPILASGGGILMDLYTPRKQFYAMLLWALIGICGPTLGPIIGGFAVEAKGWEWAIWITAWMGTATLVTIVFFLPETSADNILYRRALRLRRATGDRRYICEAQIRAEDTPGKESILTHLVRPFTLVITEPAVFFLQAYGSFIYGLMYIWFEALPLAYAEVYHFELGIQAMALLGLIVGVLVIIPPFFLYYRLKIEPSFDKMGNIVPEKLLIPAMLGCLLPPASLLIFGFTAKSSIHWVIPIVGSTVFTSGAVLLFISFLNYLGESYPDHISSVFAGNELFTSICGGTFPLLVPVLYHKFGILGSSIILAIFAVAYVPIPFVFYAIGAKLRKQSRYANKSM
ncbi:Caffeine resistance protein 5 [Colletotrichum spinosum]|uniref:Caffeine resistance protein 5 n=1 Tax=Colletotrichum spinosum TaxID=1347390 RepID=A0A4R8QTP2_9PEZI|nr:Caffeine resistance protein 5 [Colletotrichum spinosum]